MATVSQILQTKGGDVITVAPDLTVLDALRVMADHNIGALLVVEGDGGWPASSPSGTMPARWCCWARRRGIRPWARS